MFDLVLLCGLGKYVSYFFLYKNNMIGKFKSDFMFILVLLVRCVIMELVLWSFEYLLKRMLLGSKGCWWYVLLIK